MAGKLKVALLAMPEYEQNLSVARKIQSRNNKDKFAVEDYPDEVDALMATGLNAVWNFDAEAGRGFAESVITHLRANLEEKNGKMSPGTT